MPNGMKPDGVPVVELISLDYNKKIILTMKKIIWNRILATGIVLLSLSICALSVYLAGILAKIIVKLFLFGFNLI